MNLSVGSHDIFLQLHPAYCSSDDGSLLQQVSKYRPLVDWLTKFRPDASLHKLSQITICNVSWVSKRIESVALDVEFISTSEGAPRITQSFSLTEYPQTVLIPLLKVNGTQFPLLVRQERAALGGQVSEEAFIGNVNADGFEGPHSAILISMGFNLAPTALTELRSGSLSFADGLPPANFAKVELEIPQDEAQQFLEQGGKLFEGGVYVKALTQSEVLSSSSDLKTVLACTLLQ